MQAVVGDKREFQSQDCTAALYFLSEVAGQSGVNLCLTGCNAGATFERLAHKSVAKLHQKAGASLEEMVMINRTRLFPFYDVRLLQFAYCRLGMSYISMKTTSSFSLMIIDAHSCCQ